MSKWKECKSAQLSTLRPRGFSARTIDVVIDEIQNKICILYIFMRFKAKLVCKFCIYLILPSGMSIDVAGHEPPTLSILGSMLGLREGETRPLDGSIGVTPLQSLPPSSALCPRPCPPEDPFAGSHVSWHTQKMTAFSALPFQTATFWYLRYESWYVFSSLFAACASGSKFRRIPCAPVTFCWWSMSRLHTAMLTRHSIWWILVWLV